MTPIERWTIASGENGFADVAEGRRGQTATAGENDGRRDRAADEKNLRVMAKLGVEER